MENYSIIKMKFVTPVHIGAGTENYDFSSSDLHSDTLTAALAAIRAQHGRLEDLEGFMASFALSSAFPYSGDSLFLPKPMGKMQVKVKGEEEHEFRKKIKKIKFIESDLYDVLAKGECLEVDDEQLEGAFLLKQAVNWKQPYMNHVNQRVSIPRDGGEADPFFFDWRYFNDNAGLYCITDATGELLEELLQLFQELGEIGVGTDKNVGGGKFLVERAELKLTLPENANAMMLLSLYIPAEEEIEGLQLEKAKYSLLLRGGYMAGSSSESLRHLWKKSIYMFGAGSVFPTREFLKGKIVNLAPKWNDERAHPVYRSGIPFYIPIKLVDYE